MQNEPPYLQALRRAARLLFPVLLAIVSIALLWPNAGRGATDTPVPSRHPLLPPKQAVSLSATVGLSTTLEQDASWFSNENQTTRSVAWGDVDADGDLDLAVGDYGEPNKLYLNEDGMLTLSASWQSNESDATESVAWGDVDADGDLDLAVGNSGPNKLYLNEDGMLTLSANWQSDDDDWSKSVAWGDVDGDGDLDLAVGNEGQANKLYKNEGGTLSQSADWQSNDSDLTQSVAWGDVDADGDLDLAVGNSDQANKLYLNEGGTLNQSADWQSNESDDSRSVAWGDVDADGDPDLTVGNYEAPNKLYLNEGGMLTLNASWQSTESDRSESVAWGDVDGDGDLDLAVGNWDQANKFYLNESGTLNQSADWQSNDNDDTSSIAWGDVDGDGDLDLTVGNYTQANKLYKNEGGTLNQSAGWQSNDSDQTANVAWGDVDADGDLDLAVGNVDQANKLYLNEGGTLNQSADWQSKESDATVDVAWGDVDADGDLDLAVANLNQANKLYKNEDGTLNQINDWESNNSNNSSSVVWGDVDGDGDLDLAVGDIDQPNKLYKNEGGTLNQSADWQSKDFDATSDVAWGDVDADGDLDLAVANYEQPNKLYLNEGGMLTLDATWQSDESDQTVKLAWGDVDADGDLDLAIANRGDPNKLYLNEGGMLTASASWQSEESDPSINVAWGDVDGDGDLDLAVANEQQPNKLYLNEGGTLSQSANWQSNESDLSVSVAWGDVDADGDLDLAVGNVGQANKLYLNHRPAHPLHPHQSVAMNISTLAYAPAEFYALPKIHTGVIPITYTLSNPAATPMSEIRAFYSPDGGGRWREAVATSDTMTTNLSTTGEEHVYNWDVLASGFFGQSDNMVLRLEALPNQHPITNSIPGPFQRPFVSAQSYPFAVRGSQVQVLSGTVPVKDALVYRLPAGQMTGGEAYANHAGKPFRSDGQGYLEGRGDIAMGDMLIALLPVTSTETYTLYYTNATPTESGLTGYMVEDLGVQQLVVSANNPLILFDLDLSLEWDARNDADFLTNLEAAIKVASDVLYDVSNGQAAIGEVHVHQAKENWQSSNIVMYAANNIRPRANMGGIVSRARNDIGLNGLILEAYLPGQVRMGPNWDPFGESYLELGEDWWRALAHELAHYLLFLPDNYIGIRENGNLTALDCKGSFMTNTYDDDYSEFLTPAEWIGDCEDTIAAKTTGRSDWETITTFYPMLNDIGGNPGPSTRPLEVTQVTFVDLLDESTTLPVRNFDLRDAQTSALLPLPQALGYLFKTRGTSDLTDDIVIALGTSGANGDRIKVRGAEVGDRLCLFDSSSRRVGCESVTEVSVSVSLSEVPDWQPEIVVTPVSSRTFAITATLVSDVAQLNVQVLPAYGSPITPTLISAPWDEMIPLDPANPLIFSQVITLPYPAFEGFVRVWVPGSTPEREAISQFYLSAAWGPAKRGAEGNIRPWEANTRPWAGNTRAWGAPVASGDGQVTIFNVTDPFGETGISALQALTTLPNLPSWFTLVGQAYQITLLETPNLTRTISFDYLQRDVPDGYERTLTIYHSPDSGQSWQRLATDLDIDENLAATQMPTDGEGIYALISTIVMPAFQAGWNLLAYTVPETRPPSTALASIEDYYTSVYFYKVAQDQWLLHDNTIINEQPEFAPLVNDLTELEFGYSYLLYATEAVTLYLSVPSDTSDNQAANREMGFDLPPATFYGPILPTETTTPTLGMIITATINETICGQSTVEELNGQLVYKIQVATDTGNDCGVEGATVTFSANGQVLGTRPWNNSQAWYYAFGPTNKLYLPMIRNE